MGINKVRIFFYQSKCLFSGLFHYLKVAHYVTEPEFRQAALTRTEKFTRTSYVQILLRQFEPVACLRHSRKPFMRGISGGLSKEYAIRSVFSPPYASSHLMELGKTVSLSMFNHHHRYVRYIHADLYHGGSDKYIKITFSESIHYFLLLGGLHLAVYQPQFQVLEDLTAQMLVHAFGRSEFRFGSLFNPGIDDKGLMSFLDLIAYKGIGGIPSGFVYPVCGDRLKLSRFFPECGYIHVPKNRHHKASGYRGSGHDKRIRPASFLAQCFSLFHAELMLLVNHHQPQILEFKGFLYQRMRSYYDVGLPRGNFRAYCLFVFRGHPAYKKPYVKAKRHKGLAHRDIMLAGQYLGRNHHCRLIPVTSRQKKGEHRYDGLSASDIPLEKAIHRLLRGHVFFQVLDAFLLSVREFEGEELLKIRHKTFSDLVADTFFSDLASSKGHHCLQNKKLLEYQPLIGPLQIFGRIRKMYILYREPGIDQFFPRAYPGRKRVLKP